MLILSIFFRFTDNRIFLLKKRRLDNRKISETFVKKKFEVKNKKLAIIIAKIRQKRLDLFALDR